MKLQYPSIWALLLMNLIQKPMKQLQILVDLMKDAPLDGQNNSIKIQQNFTKTPKATTSKKKHFVEVTPEEVDKMAANNHIPKTKRQTNWGIKVFRGKENN